MNGKWIYEYVPIWRYREYVNFQAWLFCTWAETPLVDGYRRLGTGMRGWRVFGLEKRWEERS